VLTFAAQQKSVFRSRQSFGGGDPNVGAPPPAYFLS